MKAKSFETFVKHRKVWLFKPQNLKRAADVIYDHYYYAGTLELNRTFEEIEKDDFKGRCPKMMDEDEREDIYEGQPISVYFLLIRYAIENLLKGLLVSAYDEIFGPSCRPGDLHY